MWWVYVECIIQRQVLPSCLPSHFIYLFYWPDSFCLYLLQVIDELLADPTIRDANVTKDEALVALRDIHFTETMINSPRYASSTSHTIYLLVSLPFHLSRSLGAPFPYSLFPPSNVSSLTLHQINLMTTDVLWHPMYYWYRSDLSGGWKMKLLIVKAMLSKANVLLLDEVSLSSAVL